MNNNNKILKYLDFKLYKIRKNRDAVSNGK